MMTPAVSFVLWLAMCKEWRHEALVVVHRAKSELLIFSGDELGNDDKRLGFVSVCCCCILGYVVRVPMLQVFC
jgi:hypothetical protein